MEKSKIETVFLQSQTLEVSIDIWVDPESSQDEEEYCYRFIAEDEMSFSVIDIDLEGEISTENIAEVYHAVEDCLNGKDVQSGYLWGNILFFFQGMQGHDAMTIVVCLGEMIEDCADILCTDSLNLEFSVTEVKRFKDFLAGVCRKIGVK